MTTDQKYEYIKRLVIQKVIEPKIAELMGYRMGRPTARRFLRQLTKEKIIKKSGRGYVLIKEDN